MNKLNDGQTPILPDGYETFLGGLKERIRAAQVRAALAVNRELILLGRMGRQRHQSPCCRPQPGIPRRCRIQSSQSQIYEGFGRGLSGC